jgi:hemerythrin
VEDLDADHQALIDLLNQLGEAVEGGAGHDAIGPRLDELVTSAESHFRREEEIMAREGYPEAEHHQRLHEALIEEIREFRGSFEGGAEFGSEITEFIRIWLVSHILESDKQLGGYLRAKTRG